MKKQHLICLFLAIVLLSSCSTVNKFKSKDTMYIMVYDYDNKPVQGMKFYIYEGEVENADYLLQNDPESLSNFNYSFKGESDVNGRFMLEIDTNDTKEHILKSEKYGYNTIYSKIVYSTTGVVYLKTGNVAQFLTKAEETIDSKDYISSLDYIEMAESIEKADDILYLKAVILKALNRTEQLIATIAEISPKFKETNYVGDLYEKI